jgi:hypothetical protein
MVKKKLDRVQPVKVAEEGKGGEAKKPRLGSRRIDQRWVLNGHKTTSVVFGPDEVRNLQIIRQSLPPRLKVWTQGMLIRLAIRLVADWLQGGDMQEAVEKAGL